MKALSEALKSVVVLVEGISDKHLLARLIHDRQLPQTSIISCQGQGNLQARLQDLDTRLQGLADSSNVTTVNKVAIVFDMENDAGKIETDIQSCLAHNPVNTPCNIYLLGDVGAQRGGFETLCLESIELSDPALVCANELIDCIKDTVTFNRAQQDKAILQAYAVARKELEGKLQNVVNFNHRCFDELAQFIQSLHV